MKYYIIGLCCGLLIGFGFYKYNKPVAQIKYITKDKHIRDSLYIVNDSIQTKIKYLTKIYYAKRDSILNNDSSADMRFFTNYIDSFQRANKNR